MASSVNPSTTIEKETGYRTQLMSGSTEPLDVIFPLFDNVFQQVRISRLLYYPIVIYYFLQLLFISLWPITSFWKKENVDESTYHVFSILRTVLFFRPENVTEKSIIITILVLLGVNIIALSCLTTQLFYYKIHRSFLKFANYPIKLFGDVIMTAICVPTTVAVGNAFMFVVEKGANQVLWLLVFVGIIEVVFECLFFYTIQSLCSKSVCIVGSPFLNFDPFVPIANIISTVVILFFCYILEYFDDWAVLVGVVCHVSIYGYILYRVMFMPYVSPASNPITAGGLTTIIINDVLSFIFYFIPSINHAIPLIATLCIFVVATIVFVIFFKKRTKKIIEHLTLDETLGAVTHEEERFDYYDSLGLSRNEKLALMYLHVGFKNMCPLFLDWSLLKYILQRHSSENAVCGCLQILNFFPGESRLLNRLTVTLTSRRNLNFVQRFLIFQVYKIKTLRQFSASSDSNLKLSELKSMSRQCESMARGVWDMQTISTGFYEELSSVCSHAHAVWTEALYNYPNNPKFCEEFCRYLIECECNFPEALKIKRRGELIEVGKNYSIDYSFRSMVRLFPHYLKKGILDLKGNMKGNTQSRRGSSSSSSQQTRSQSFSSSESSQLDDEVEDTVGRQTINQAKARLALHRAIENKLPKSIKCIIPVTIIVLIVIVSLFVFIIVFSDIKLSNQTESMMRLDYISKTRFYLALGSVQIIMELCKEKGTLDGYLTELKKLQGCGGEDFIEIKEDSSEDYLKPTAKWVKESADNIQLLVNDLAVLANSGSDVYSLSKSLLVPKEQFSFCTSSGLPFPTPSNISLSAHISIIQMHQRVLSGASDVLGMFNDSPYCELTVNQQSFYKYVNEIFSSFCQFQLDKGDDLKFKFNVIMYTVPAVIFLIVLVPYIILHSFTVRSLNRVTNIIMSLDTKTRSDSKDLISLNVDSDDIKTSEARKSKSKSAICIVLLCIIGAIFLAFSIIMAYISVKSNDSIIQLNSWDQFAALRLSLSAELFNIFLFGITIADNPSITLLTNTKTISVLVSKQFQELNQANQDLIQGTNTTEPCAGYDDEIDELNINDKNVKSSDLSVHEIYSNASINQQIAMLSEFLTDVVDSLYSGTAVDESKAANIIHLINGHLLKRLERVIERFGELATVEFNTLMNTMGYMCIGIGFLIIVFIIIIYEYYKNRVNAFKASLFVLKRVQPITLINNKLFMHEFLNNKEELREEKLSVAGNVIHNATDAIFCTSLHGVVEIVNTAVTSLLGYTPEQLLGQPVPAFFVQSDEEKISAQLELMRNGQSSAFFEDKFTAMTDTSQLVPCLVTILGMKPQHSDEIKSFVVILRDQTALLTQQKQAEEAKAKSEQLLFQILPRDIVVKLNRGEKDISFSVASASVIFIDIVRFSEYSMTLSPQEIMGNLSLYFAQIDRTIAKYDEMTKIKLIGDIYMAAAGLFNQDAPPEKHAEQTIRFAIDVLTELDDINVKLNANLSIRIGVNSGGPIIAGVLGKDKPVFDIIGDAINVAARLQTTDEPNHIQIPQSTYDLISGLQFNIEPRGEVYLKGKGQTMTYFVTPTSTLLAQISSNDFSVKELSSEK